MRVDPLHDDGSHVAVLLVTGRMNGVEAKGLPAIVRDIVAKGIPNVAVNLGGVTAMTVAGLRHLIAARLIAFQRGGDLKLVNPPQQEEQEMSEEVILCLAVNFESFATNRAAIFSFEPPPAPLRV